MTPIENKALKVILDAFQDKIDKGGMDYVDHLLRVHSTVTKWGFDQNVRTAALLHDILEDCPETWNHVKLMSEFGIAVSTMVYMLTKPDNENYEEYIDRVLYSKYGSAIKLADLKDNMNICRLKTILPHDLKRLQKYHTSFERILKEFPEFNNFNPRF